MIRSPLIKVVANGKRIGGGEEIREKVKTT